MTTIAAAALPPSLTDVFSVRPGGDAGDGFAPVFAAVLAPGAGAPVAAPDAGPPTTGQVLEPTSATPTISPPTGTILPFPVGDLPLPGTPLPSSGDEAAAVTTTPLPPHAPAAPPFATPAEIATPTLAAPAARRSLDLPVQPRPARFTGPADRAAASQPEATPAKDDTQPIAADPAPTPQPPVSAPPVDAPPTIAPPIPIAAPAAPLASPAKVEAPSPRITTARQAAGRPGRSASAAPPLTSPVPAAPQDDAEPIAPNPRAADRPSPPANAGNPSPPSAPAEPSPPIVGQPINPAPAVTQPLDARIVPPAAPLATPATPRSTALPGIAQMLAAPGVIGTPVRTPARPFADQPAPAIGQPLPIATATPAIAPPATPTAAPQGEARATAPAASPAPPLAQPGTAAPVEAVAPALPALQAFGEALHRAAAAERRPLETDPTAPATIMPIAVATAAAVTASAAPLDTTQPHWPEAMVARIEQIRDAQDAADTRIRLHPDALGTIDVALRRDSAEAGGRVHVHLVAAEPATRALLAEAQPRLADIAETRGLRLAGTSVDGGGAQANSGNDRRPPAPTPATPRAPRPAATAPDPDSDPTTRLA